jgi:hypothetical protein
VIPLHRLRQKPAFGTEQELIDVDEGDPSTRVGAVLQAVVVDALLSASFGRAESHLATIDPWLKNGHELIDARVVVQKEVVDADESVEFEPLTQVGRFVLEDRADPEFPVLTDEEISPTTQNFERKALGPCQEMSGRAMSPHRLVHQSPTLREGELT